jgi:tetratricopeptide (TPR) repeat protein
MKKLRNVDTAQQVFDIKTATYAVVGALLGAAGGLYFARTREAPVPVIILATIVGGVAGFCMVFFSARTLAHASGSALGQIYSPSGSSNPIKREYSKPQALEARGHYDEAILAYEVFCINFPDEPEPFIRIGRLLRDHLQRYDEAVSWLRKARSAKMPQALELLVTQEIFEIYTHRLGQPQRAIPELARLTERFPGTDTARWAEEQLQRLRSTIRQENA